MKHGGIDYRACRNLVQIFFDQATQYGDQPFLWAKRPHDGGSSWQSWSWRRAADDVRRLAAGLAALGRPPGDRVGLVSGNRPEWAIPDRARIAAGRSTGPPPTAHTPDHHRPL